MTRNGLHIARPVEDPERAGAVYDRPPALSSATETPRASAHTVRDALLDQLDALYRFILVRVGFDESAAEDVLQQTAEAALRSAARAPAGAVEPWLWGVARNHLRRHWRERGACPLPDAESGRRALELLEGQCPREALQHRESRHALLWAIASLPADEQRLLYAFYRRGRTQAEIAAELGCTQKAVEMRLYRVREGLREALRSCGEER